MNNPHKTARIKLTLLYFGIIFFIVVVFSAIVISTHNKQFAQFEQLRKEVMENADMIRNPYVVRNVERVSSIVSDIKHDFLINVLVLDASLIAAAILISFYLSGQTLEPIVEALHRQKKFVSDASHELRTPLTAIKTEAEVLARSKSSSLDEYKQFTQSLVEEVDKLSSLTENLLQIARIDNQQTKNEISEFDAVPLIERLIDRYTPIADKKGVQLRFTYDEEKVFSVATDRMKYERLLSIILDNGIKYNKPEGILEIKLAIDHKDTVVIFEDTGIGISKEDLLKIFDRFYRASEARTGEGFGLGLSIAKELASQLNAQIKVKSELGKGSTFEVRL
jgi:signal transduction histidine kinase